MGSHIAWEGEVPSVHKVRPWTYFASKRLVLDFKPRETKLCGLWLKGDNILPRKVWVVIDGIKVYPQPSVGT